LKVLIERMNNKSNQKRRLHSNSRKKMMMTLMRMMRKKMKNLIVMMMMIMLKIKIVIETRLMSVFIDYQEKVKKLTLKDTSERTL
jgi:hypothetical protein